MARDSQVVLSFDDLRAVTTYAVECSRDVIEIFEAGRPGDGRPRQAIETALEFARGGSRGKALRDAAAGAIKAASDAGTPAAAEAARSAMCAASAPYLHALADAHQVKHILGAAAHAARAAELAAGDDRAVGAEHLERAGRRTPRAVAAVLKCYPAAPEGGGRVGELMRMLDRMLR